MAAGWACAVAADAQATRSAAMMRDAVSAMERIERSSNQITTVVGVVDDLAAQTNILALNATSEASSAGDGGRGFLVVADEVRTLARRSVQAGEQIKDLIRQTSKDVADGVDLIGRTGNGVDGIMEANRMTQSNVVPGERSATSVRNLHDHAATLAALVHHIKIESLTAQRRAA